jgi:hypothetical protein
MLLRGLGCLVVLGSVVGCLVDDDDVCGAYQHRIEVEFLEGCVCDDGAVPNAGGIGCRLCGEHEKVVGDACAPADESDAGPEEEPGTSGQDMACGSSADCAGFDATFCLTLLPPTRCLVEHCADGSRRCASDRECCVITIVPELAAAGGICVEQGMCTAPGMVVTP